MLQELVEQFGGRCELEGPGPEVRGVVLDSRRVRSGDLFVALRGGTTDGRRYLEDARRAGASAVLLEEAPRGAEAAPAELPLWFHEDARSVAGLAAARVLGDPSRKLLVIAVTGTNGKTTTAHLVGELLTAAGRRPAVLGTTGYRLAGGEELAATHTTPDAPTLQGLLAEHVERGGDSVVLEVSSHALTQGRICGVDVDVAIYTNLSRDHLDYHGDMEQYAAAKSLMFSSLDRHAVAIVNQDDERSPLMARAARDRGCRVLSYSTETQADLRASRLSFGPDDTYLTLSGMGISLARLRIPLSGRFNVENALAASAAVLVSGVSPSTIVEGLASVSTPAGRLEPVPLEGAGAPRVLVDYAHTPEALARVLGALREGAEGRLLCVFGCGGGRDRGKRAEMGRVASSLADLVIATSDNPRQEDPEAILADVRVGTTGPAEVRFEVDRRLAIREALRAAEAGDTVLIAGKGHETGQVVGAETRAFDDRVVVREEWS